MGKENVNQNFNHTMDTGGLSVNQQETKMNVNGAINVHTDTQGVNVEKSDVKQNVNQDVKTQAEQTTQVQTSTHVGEAKTVDVKQDVTADVQTNSKIPVNDVNTGETLKESKENAGVNHTQTALGQDVTTKQEKMDSSSVEHVSVSDETTTVGSYSDDAKNNGVFGIDAQNTIKNIDVNKDETSISTGINIKEVSKGLGRFVSGGKRLKVDPKRLRKEIAATEAVVNQKNSEIENLIKSLINVNESVSNKVLERQRNLINDVIPQMENYYKMNQSGHMSMELFVGIVLGLAEGVCGLVDIIVPDEFEEIKEVLDYISSKTSDATNLYVNYDQKGINYIGMIENYVEGIATEATKQALKIEAEAATIEAASVGLDVTVIGAPAGVIGNILGAQMIIEVVNRGLVVSALSGLLIEGILPAKEIYSIAGKMKVYGNTLGTQLIQNKTSESLELDPIVFGINKQATLIQVETKNINNNTGEIIRLLKDVATDFEHMDMQISNNLNSSDKLNDADTSIVSATLSVDLPNQFMTDSINNLKMEQECKLYDELCVSSDLEAISHFSNYLESFAQSTLASICRNLLSFYANTQNYIKAKYQEFTDCCKWIIEQVTHLAEDNFAKYIPGLNWGLEQLKNAITKGIEIIHWIGERAIGVVLSLAGFPSTAEKVVDEFDNLKSEIVPWNEYLQTIHSSIKNSLMKNVYGDKIEEINSLSSDIMSQCMEIGHAMKRLIARIEESSEGLTIESLTSIKDTVEKDIKHVLKTVSYLANQSEVVGI